MYKTMDAPLLQHLHPPTSSTMQQHEDDEDFQVLPIQRMPLDEPEDLLPSDPDSESEDSEEGSDNGAEIGVMWSMTQ